MEFEVEDVQDGIIFEEEFDLRSPDFSIRKNSLDPSEQATVEDLLEEVQDVFEGVDDALEEVKDVLDELKSDEKKINSEILKKRTCVIVQGLIFIISLTVLVNVLFLGYINRPTNEDEFSCELQDIIGDGYCDDEANTFICGFDGGDCCGDNVLTGNCHQCMCLSKFTKTWKNVVHS